MQYISAGDKSPDLLWVSNGIAVDNDPTGKEGYACHSLSYLARPVLMQQIFKRQILLLSSKSIVQTSTLLRTVCKQTKMLYILNEIGPSKLRAGFTLVFMSHRKQNLVLMFSYITKSYIIACLQPFLFYLTDNLIFVLRAVLHSSPGWVHTHVQKFTRYVSVQ